MILQQLQQGLAPAGTLRHEQDAPPELVDKLTQGGTRVGAAHIQGQSGRRACLVVVATGLALQFEALDLTAAMGADLVLQMLWRKEQFVRRQDRAVTVVAALLEAFLRLLPKVLCRLIIPFQAEDQGGGGQVVEQSRGLREKQWQIVFDTGRGQSLADIFIDIAALRVALEAFPELLAKALDGFFVQRKLTGG